MDKFQINTISDNVELVSRRLKTSRRAQKLELADAAKATNINILYLDALENGHFEKLPQGLYGKNFLKEYAEYLGVEAAELIDLAAPEIAEYRPKNSKLFSERITHPSNFLSLPKLIKGLFAVAAISVCVIYLGGEFGGIISPPRLEIINPAANLFTGRTSVDIEGYTEPEAEVTINDLPVLTGPDGHFIQKVNLKSGLNTISVTAQKKYSRKNNVVKKILVNNETSLTAPKTVF
ncbi:hypothetical protein A2303_07405 [Candidatus Falkowbacteria bacterium RIFOXYB2_FULL_47_14]|uniref:HTH cro/C1-type domain-containing protein n=1 Tax=Candidatus Falkowbacteria bacterium RIFOXYA2_FULL_47_19 TaxID=1797994 RepID=A0A1F5SGQ3_9BACT|nr:MAG: hypothetical protein A2227_01155 [Candidatus Falkowbacteria bacterium RIFOXYA2_FULL_47_19]OGF34973.1 MAG: hypothetical protein A2468_07110 [Candidatus Falkowbacteria bacterium RIFOXYC2_FULL_46_15]OGF43688.1 MAG: hypothetical protein A2303_07405 [Candidatus Falkowbacteria bacterium RIFOXYB2_FULL_47_14]